MKKSKIIYWYKYSMLECSAFWGVSQNLWQKVQGTPEDTITHICPPIQNISRHHHPYISTNPKWVTVTSVEDSEYCWQRGVLSCQNHQRDHILKGQQFHLKRNIGKYILPHILDRDPFNSTELKVKNKQEHQVHNSHEAILV